MKSINQDLKTQLKQGLTSGKIKVKYPDGYKKWKQKFDYWYNVTKDINQTFDIMYGPGGGVNNYKGSIYRNSNLDVSKLETNKRKPVHKSKKKSNNGALGLFKKKGKK